jgi:hypothetical protein
VSFEDENNGEDPIKEAYELGIKQGQKTMQAELTTLKQRIDGITVEDLNYIVNTHLSKYGLVEAFCVPEHFAEIIKAIHDKIKGV